MRSAFAIAYHVLQHREDAEDAVQQSFMAALARLDTFDVTRPFAPWFGRVVLNHARSARAAAATVSGAAPPRRLRVAGSALPRPHRTGRAETRSPHRVRAAMNMLPERQRLAIQLIEIDGYTPAEVATMLDSRRSRCDGTYGGPPYATPAARTLGHANTNTHMPAKANVAQRHDTTDQTVPLPEPGTTQDSADAGPDHREAADGRDQ